MNDDELERLLDVLERGLSELVQDALTETADEFEQAVDDADELVAAVFSVSRIADMWRRRVGGIMTRLRSIAQRGAETAAEEVDEPVPAPEELNPLLDAYEASTRPLVDAVGDHLAQEAVNALNEGLAAGEITDQLKERLVAVFNARTGELGPTRARRIAATEAHRAFNAGVFAAARALSGEERPVVKQWLTRNDEKVRQAHKDANGQIQFLDEPFDVGGTPMQYPGDPTAPANLTVNCRCILRASAASERTASVATEELQSRMPAQLKKYWLTGPGAVKIKWGTPGSFDRCVRELRDDFPEDPEGLCANLYHEATGRWPGENRSATTVQHTGAMIALMPSAEDAARMAVQGGEAVDQLHVTLAFLGEAADWSEDQRAALINRVSAAADSLGPVQGKAFGVARWNPLSKEPVWVWNVGDDLDHEGSRLKDVYDGVHFRLGEAADEWPEIPQQHSPWAPHMTITYGSLDQAAANEAIGPVTFDRIAVVFGGEFADIPLFPTPVDNPVDEPMGPQLFTPDIGRVIPWSTPGMSALAFENQQTGDGRLFAPGALYWDGSGPWPLQYADAMLGGHDGARLAGSIQSMSREDGRITGDGVLYLTQDAGLEAAMLLAQNAPLGVSVDLDDVDLEMVDVSGTEAFQARLVAASVLPLPDGGCLVKGETAPEIAAASDMEGMVSESRRVVMTVSPEGMVPSSLFELTAAAGDPDAAGEVLDQQLSGEVLMRITRGRVRGATLVTIPAYADARIVLDDQAGYALAASAAPATLVAGAATSDYDRVVRQVRKSVGPMSAGELARFLKMPVTAVRRYLARAAKKGDLVRLTRGAYVAPSEPDATAVASAVADLEQLVASVTGAVDLPVADRDHVWDGAAAETRVFDWADGDTGKIGRAFAYRDDEKDPATKGAYKLGYADVLDGVLTIIPAGVSAALGALHGARGGVDLPEDERGRVAERLDSVAVHVAEELGDDDMDLSASAWAAMAELPPMPAAWFREPTVEELPPGSGGVHYANGRIFGWVAQAGEPHAGFAKKITIDTLGKIDTTHFLRQRFTLDDGSVVKAGTYTMNAGHHRDGAECETSACQFDDTRTVAGIVTVGMNERGMWFSGAAAPWLGEWDRMVFAATQPSYHMKKGKSGWQLRAVLSVPVPGHSSPLLASAVVERSQLALTAALVMAGEKEAEAEAAAAQGTAAVDVSGIDYDRLADAIVAAGVRAEERKAAEAEELRALLAEVSELGITTGTEGN